MLVVSRYALPMRRLTDQPELLDGPLDHGTLVGNMRDLVRINRWLGGIALSRRALVTLATGAHGRPAARCDWRHRALRLLDVGTGAADIPMALLDWTDGHGLKLRVDALDERPEILQVAAGRVAGRAGLWLEHTAGDELAFDTGAFDVAHASLVIHHLKPAAARRLLQEMARVSRLGVIINDLERSRVAWFGAWVLTRTLTGNLYTRNDAPLSVKRAYRADEVAEMAGEAGLAEVARIHGYLGHRYALALVPTTGRSQNAGARSLP